MHPVFFLCIIALPTEMRKTVLSHALSLLLCIIMPMSIYNVSPLRSLMVKTGPSPFGWLSQPTYSSSPYDCLLSPFLLHLLAFDVQKLRECTVR